MPRIAYVNGRYLPSDRALVSIEDRGYQFSDGVYEVCEVRGGAIIDERRHLARLARSLGELRIRAPMAQSALAVILREVIRRNRVHNGIVYLQITRGVARRDFAFPPPHTQPSLVVTARNLDLAANERRADQGLAVVTVPENRWARPDIKSVSLLANVLAKQAARDRGAAEAWFVDGQGRVTEGASSNAWIVTADGRVVTRPADNGILRGITRTVLIGVIKAQNLLFEERPFSLEEAYRAREAFVTAASQIVMPVTRIDDRPVGDGAPGPVAKSLRASFHSHAEWS
ncbi:MAG TPA: D-amino-acid transaminase [Xanthobacteraceae bacterium]|nr:D-amino-acid transaminase [Xanthobacteraceae bacterium]